MYARVCRTALAAIVLGCASGGGPPAPVEPPAAAPVAAVFGEAGAALAGGSRAADLLALVRLADELDVRLILAGAAEAWMVASELAAANVPVVIDPMQNLPGFESLGVTLENAARLQGRQADLVVWSGDPFEVTTRAEHVLICGREVPVEMRQRLLFERYRTLPRR